MEAKEQERNRKEQQAASGERVKKAQSLLSKYRTGKQVLDARVVSNNQWYRMRHWGEFKKATTDQESTSAWLLNTLMSKHADAMDNYPAPAVLPREEMDVLEAEKLTDVLPLILEQNDFQKTYSDLWWDKLKTGTGIYGVFWDPGKLNGLGDIVIRNIDILSLYWEPGVEDIQDSANVFLVTLVDTEQLQRKYTDKDIRDSKGYVKEYIHDDSIDTSGKSMVVDWYYKLDGVLHFCKYVGSTVLYCTEDDPELAQRGLYDHGLYPFVFDTTFPIKDSAAGFGYLDIMKSPQEYIDKMNQAFLKNTLWSSKPRYFVREDANVNLQALADTNVDFVKVGGNFSQDTIRMIDVPTLPGNYLNVLQMKVDELKETSGNRDVSNGGSTSGVTAASAIAAMQEASGKTSRDIIKASYYAYAEVIRMCIELIRQFYDEPRTFRITGPDGGQDFVRVDNSALAPQETGSYMDIDGQLKQMYHSAEFDVKVSAQKASAYSTLAQNELAKEFFSAGFFNPELSDQALACVEMMEFEGKDGIVKKIQQNGTLFDQVQQLQQQVLTLAQVVDTLEPGRDITNQLAAQMSGQAMPGGSTQYEAPKGSQADKARATAAETTTPR